MSYEHDKAIKEGEFNAAWQAWVDACPARNTSLAEGLFKAGFDRGWERRENSAGTDRIAGLEEHLKRHVQACVTKDAEIAQLKKDVTHWQANHANEVKRSRILKERPDMPITRVHAYKVWGEDLEEITRLRNKLAAAEASAQSVFLDYMARDTEATELAQQLYILKKPSNPAATVRRVNGTYQVFWHQCPPGDGTQLYLGPVHTPEPKTAGTEVQLSVIRKWPAGFQERFFAVWADLAGMIPSVRLYDLQRVLAEFGFTMKVYEDPDHPDHRCGGLGCDGTCCQPVIGVDLGDPRGDQTAVVTVDQLVNRFLCWELPEDFGPDCGITFQPIDFRGNRAKPVGTNLLTALQARQMIEHILGTTK